MSHWKWLLNKNRTLLRSDLFFVLIPFHLRFKCKLFCELGTVGFHSFQTILIIYFCLLFHFFFFLSAWQFIYKHTSDWQFVLTWLIWLNLLYFFIFEFFFFSFWKFYFKFLNFVTVLLFIGWFSLQTKCNLWMTLDVLGIFFFSIISILSLSLSVNYFAL